MCAGIKTIGFGTACHSYPCDTLHPPLTRDQAEKIMLADVTARFGPCVRNNVRVPLNSNQFSALASFVYNVGCGDSNSGFRGSTLLRQLNQGCYSCVKNDLMMWTKAGGRVLAGLVARRSAEAALFNNAVISPCLDGSGGTGSSSGQSWGACSRNGVTGDCIDVSDCDTTPVSGLCNGPASVKCCFDTPPNPPLPPADRCGNGGTCKARSTCSTSTNTVRTGLCPGDSSIICCQPIGRTPRSLASDGWWDGATRDELSGTGASMATSWNGVAYKPKIVIHTTEGGSYEGARSAYAGTQPHFTVTFQRGFFQAYQHLTINAAAKALKHPYGTVDTNRGNAYQIEVVGFATKASSMPAKYLDGIASLVKWISQQKGVANKAPTFLPYPASYGQSSVRMTPAQWVSFSGVCGHQHVPENDHGDPGAFQIHYVLTANGPITAPPATSTSTVPGTNGLPGDWGTCSSSGKSGRCQERSSCGGTVLFGLCPSAPSSVACCIENWGTCTVPATATVAARTGLCQESSTCGGAKLSGLCPGPASVSCCVADHGTCSSGTLSGTCVSTASCKGSVVAGLCAGGSDITCCLPAKPVSYGSCSVSYPDGHATGSCISKSSCRSPMISAAGLCAGPADIACCHTPVPVRTYGSCGTNGGQCQDTSTCTGTVVRGLCAGASNIACCEYTARKAAMTSAPLNTPRSLFAPTVVAGGVVSYGTLPSDFANVQLTMCASGSLDNPTQGFCRDGSAGSVVCNGVVTYPSTCPGGQSCCTPQTCRISNSTDGSGVGVCIPPNECHNQAGYVSSGYCGAGGVDGPTSCCTGVGLALCDSAGLLSCLLSDGDPAVCAASFNCPFDADYATLPSSTQEAPLAGPQAHALFDDPDNGVINGATSAVASASMAAFIIAAIAALATL